jgi:beta-glucosidase-like glycosyl hydrolase
MAPEVSKSFLPGELLGSRAYRTMKRELPMVLVNHANYPAVTRDKLPASLSKKWITDVLRRRIGYRGLIVSDDLEMDGVLKAGPVEQAAVEFVRAGGDLCLICHQREGIERAFETLVRESERGSRSGRALTAKGWWGRGNPGSSDVRCRLSYKPISSPALGSTADSAARPDDGTATGAGAGGVVEAFAWVMSGLADGINVARCG